jgi:prenylcysteine alpha-carboxyl methylesterase
MSYRNFPPGIISDMIADVSEGISFICNNAASYDGDPNQ